MFEALVAAGVLLRSDCGGKGRCGKCAVQVTSGVDVAREHYWFVPGRLLEHPFMTRDFAGKVSCPLLVAHGGADSIIDVHHGRELARLFHADEYIEVPRVDHNDLLFVGSIATRYLRFLDEAIPP